MPIKLNSTGGGSVSLDVPSTASTYTLTAPARTGNIITSADSNTVNQTMIDRTSFYGGFGPAFYGGVTSSQTISHNTTTKITLNSEIYDTNNCYDPTTNYRFTPTVPGYYAFHLNLVFNGTSGRAHYFQPSIYKNGISYSYSEDGTTSLNSGGRFCTNLSGVIPLNGSTDYIEFYIFQYDYTATTTIQLYGNTGIFGYFVRGL